jgi:hypothetical protein
VWITLEISRAQPQFESHPGCIVAHPTVVLRDLPTSHAYVPDARVFRTQYHSSKSMKELILGICAP